MFIYGHEDDRFLVPDLPLLLEDLDMPLVVLGLSVRLILPETPHDSLAECAVVRAPPVLLAEVDILGAALPGGLDTQAHLLDPELAHKQIDSRL
jgi:hypothetical protein